MSIRRIAEVGDGSYEQMMQKNASKEQSDLKSAQTRKKKFTSAAGKQTPPKNDWEDLKAALRVSQKPFDPENYSSYDVSGKSVRRFESNEIEEEDSFDPTTILAAHMYDDPMAILKEELKEAAIGDAMIKEGKLKNELKELENSQGWNNEASLWVQARLKGRNNEAVSASSVKGSITKTANEMVSDSRFGQMDYDSLEEREIQKRIMEENMIKNNASIKRISASKEQRQSQWENDENVRSQSVQEKMKNSQLFNKLAQIQGQ